MKLLKTIALAIVVLSISISSFAQETTGLGITMPAKKIISGGREFAFQRPVDFPEIVRQLADGPYDGISLGFDGVSLEDSTIKASIGNAWKSPKWKKEWFKKDAEILKNTPKGKLTDNYVRVYFNTAIDSKEPAKDRLKWDNDEQWATFANNLSVLAWYVKEAGFKGIILDPEDYSRSQQYFWKPSDGDYVNTCKLARKRGAELMSAMTKEYPDITLFFFWFTALRKNIVQSENPDIATAQAKDLWIPMVNGMLDKITPEAKIIEGYENYHLQGAEYNVNYRFINNNALNLIAPENKTKYRSQVLYSPAVYMTMFTSNPSSGYYFPPLNGSRTSRFLSVMKDALDVSEQYVWIWSEGGKMRPWKPKNGKLANYKFFEELLPGTEMAMKLAKNPIEQGKAELKELKAQGKAVNLAKNSDMSMQPSPSDVIGAPADKWTTGVAPAGFAIYGNSQGFSQDTTTGFNDKFSAKATGVNGGFIQTINVKPFEWYVVEVLGKKTGGYMSATIRWKTADGKWMKTYEDIDFYFLDDAGNGWNKATGTARVPEGAGQMVVLLSTTNKSATEASWFDDLGIYQIR